MRVWIVNPFDNLPAEGFRPQRFWLMARAFAAAGCKVVYWTADFSHALKKPRRAVDRPVDSIECVFVHEPPYRKNISLRRIWAHWRWAANWRKAAEGAVRPDLAVVSSPPVAIGAAVRKFCAARSIPYIVDVMDAWPETFYRIAPRFVFAPLKRIVAGNYRRAAAVTVVAKRYEAMLRRDYAVTAPIALFYHGISLEGLDGKRRGGRGAYLAYVGNMSASYDLATVVEAMRRMPDMRLKIAGSGPDEAKLRRIAPPNVEFLGYLGEKDLHEMLSGAAAGIVPMFDSSCVGVPYKLGDYIAHGLAVLTSLSGETRELLEKAGAGLYYPAGDAEALVCAARKIAACRGAPSLAPLFDAAKIYRGYVEFCLQTMNHGNGSADTVTESL